MAVKYEMTFEDTGDYWKFFINGLLHLIINKEEFIGIWSYINGIKSKAYYVDIIYKSTSMTVQYKTKELWETAIKTLNDNIN